MELPLITVNAFSYGPFTGNPAAICLLEAWLDDQLMQSIAAQNNIAETAYLVRTGEGSYHIRWFTPAIEVPLCGHATLAAAHVLKTHYNEPAERIRFESLSGDLFVTCQDSQYTLDFPSQVPAPIPTPSWIVPCLSANPSAVLENRYVLAVFESQDIVAAIEPDFPLLKKQGNGKVIITAPGKDHDFVSRFFAPSAGIDEDPVTGSAHCLLTPYWSKRLKKTKLTARQISPRGGELICELQSDRVLMTGSASTYSVATIHV